MPNRKAAPNEMLLFVDILGGTSYSQVICLENWDYPKSRPEIDAKSMCGPDKSLGQPEYGPIAFDGQMVLSASSTEVALAQLEAVFAAKTTIGWKLSRVTPVTGDLTYTGTGAVSKLDISAATDQVGKMKGAITIYGTPVLTVTA